MRSVHGHNVIEQGAFTRVDDEEGFDLVEADMEDSVVWLLELQRRTIRLREVSCVSEVLRPAGRTKLAIGTRKALRRDLGMR